LILKVFLTISYHYPYFSASRSLLYLNPGAQLLIFFILKNYRYFLLSLAE